MKAAFESAYMRETTLHQDLRRTGAGCFIVSRAIGDDILILGQCPGFFRQMNDRNSDCPFYFDPAAGIIVSRPEVNDQNMTMLHLLFQILNRYSGHPVLAASGRCGSRKTDGHHHRKKQYTQYPDHHFYLSDLLQSECLFC
jgi:hypothetical protein